MEGIPLLWASTGPLAGTMVVVLSLARQPATLCRELSPGTLPPYPFSKDQVPLAGVLQAYWLEPWSLCFSLWAVCRSCREHCFWLLLVWKPLAEAPELVLFPQLHCLPGTLCSPNGWAAPHLLLGSTCCRVSPTAEPHSVMQPGGILR